jgi:sulfoacetaldehyde acetyltransferase
MSEPDDTTDQPVHEQREMNTSEAFVEQLSAENVDHVFCIIGSAFVDLADLFPPADIDFISVRHEQNEVHMADGYAQALNGRKPGVTISQNGPGVTNMVTGLQTAKMNHSPVIALTPTPARADQELDSYQEADTFAALEPVVGWQGALNVPDRTAEYVRLAFRESLSKNTTAQVDFPRDLLYEDCVVDILSPEQYRQTEFGPAAPGETAKAADVIADAETPVILTDVESARHDAFDEVAELAELLNAPVATGFLNNDSFDGSHPHATGPIGFEASEASLNFLEEADVVVAVGSRLPSLERGPRFPDDAAIVQIFSDPSEIGRTIDVSVGLVGDAAGTTRELFAELEDRSRTVGAPDERAERIQSEREAWEETLRERSMIDDTPIDPRRALWDIREAIPTDTMVTLDVGNTVAIARPYFEPENPGNFIPAGPYGGIAFAWPAAMGANVARPDDPAIAIVGDGAFSTSLPETLTAVRYDLDVTACIFNNSQWGAEKQNQLTYYSERTIGADLPENPDFAEIAREMGAHGIRVEEPDDVTPAIEEALETDGPSVLDIITDADAMAEPFRSDALNPPRRHLEKYRQPGDPNYTE